MYKEWISEIDKLMKWYDGYVARNGHYPTWDEIHEQENRIKEENKNV